MSRGVFTTRPRDFYDVYILGTTQKYDKEIFKEALKATAIHRGSLEKIVDVNIRRLRMKIEDEPSSPKYIMTVWGMGYKWNS